MEIEKTAERNSNFIQYPSTLQRILKKNHYVTVHVTQLAKHVLTEAPPESKHNLHKTKLFGLR